MACLFIYSFFYLYENVISCNQVQVTCQDVECSSFIGRPLDIEIGSFRLLGMCCCAELSEILICRISSKVLLSET
jgi:hypothetical protein